MELNSCGWHAIFDYGKIYLRNGRSEDTIKQETPEGYFDEKRNAFSSGEDEEDEY